MATGPEETPKQRRLRYIRLADDAKAKAAKTKDRETKNAYLALADAWLALATDVDAGT
jgi:hypothetical protein